MSKQQTPTVDEVIVLPRAEFKAHIANLPEKEADHLRLLRRRKQNLAVRDKNIERERERYRACYAKRMEQLRADPEAYAAFKKREAERLRRLRAKHKG